MQNNKNSSLLKTSKSQKVQPIEDIEIRSISGSFPLEKAKKNQTDEILKFWSKHKRFPTSHTVQLVVYFIVEDYTNYWVHRLLHSKWGYDKIHKVHHEYTAPIGFAAPYAHWAEILILGIPSFLGPAMVPGHIITFWLWIALRQIEAIETHSGYDFPWTPTKYIPFYGGADYHDYHHYVGGQSHSNFASVFTYCDYIYGTDKGYRYQKKVLQQLREGLKSNGVKNGNLQDQSAQACKLD